VSITILSLLPFRSSFPPFRLFLTLLISFVITRLDLGTELPIGKPIGTVFGVRPLLGAKASFQSSQPRISSRAVASWVRGTLWGLPSNRVVSAGCSFEFGFFGFGIIALGGGCLVALFISLTNSNFILNKLNNYICDIGLLQEE
jgi:hypothetical protein